MKNQKKKILILGGTSFQVPCIKYAKAMNYHVITCDYLPDNPGHKYSDEFYNVSTTDLKAVLKLARKLEVDGVLAYASDPAAPTAAYVAEKMGLPGNPYKSVKTLSEKDLYRSFLRLKKFNTPFYGAYSSLKDFADSQEEFQYPILVKPVDSSGSKGISAVNDFWEMDKAITHAMKFSRCKRFIVEEFIEKKYPQLDGDIFVYNGKIIAYYLGDQGNDVEVNPFVPSSINYPSLLPKNIHVKIQSELQRAIDLLKIKFGGFNIEVIVDEKDEIYLIEIGARNGGNCIPDIIKCASNVDMIKMSVDACMGVEPKIQNRKDINNFYTTYVIHSNEDGKFKSLKVHESITDYVLDIRLMVEKGGNVYRFSGSNCTVGIGLLEFPNLQIRDKMMDKIEEFIAVELE
ncbi:ATP-grasp domain-containing protein [Marinifilum caeruleilacunae]|uniref:ATP-grasp domain-containing protein n=1 Tax=Marinifilum caeruleilacunae TaxID=2499076 RepID=A0ABX1WT37_9BACT|nr:ATP-grasp domain-containing protein [Marinifilum caeruleilacunae]NOU59275.1 ATP-grasp domain-containing protein [Marinifilum caeruleilacunae]